MPGFPDLPSAGALFDAVLTGLLSAVPWAALPALLDNHSGQLALLARMVGTALSLATTLYWDALAQPSFLAGIALLRAAGQVAHAIAYVGSAWLTLVVVGTLRSSNATTFVFTATALAAFAGIEWRAASRRASPTVS